MSVYGATAPPQTRIPAAPVNEGRTRLQRGLLLCGILSSLLYVAMTIFVPMRWPGYDSASRVISELSAIDAPSRSWWVPLGMVWAVLVVAFGWGIWITARGSRLLRVLGGLMIAYGVFNMFPWPPMHQREVLAVGGGTLTDALHLVWSTVAVLCMLAAIGLGAAALGGRFRLYSIATIAILLVFGALTAMDSPHLQANLPTPWIGVWERINIGAYLLWVVVLVVMLLRRPGGAPRGAAS